MDARVAAPPPNGGRREERGGAAFKEHVSLMLDKKKFRPDEKSKRRWHVVSGDGGGEHATTASGKSAFCTCGGFRASAGKERRHMRLIRLIPGLLGFAATLRRPSARSPARGARPAKSRLSRVLQGARHQKGRRRR